MKILSLGEKIKLRRKELNLTLKALAGDRITAGQISLIESGKSNPSMDLLEYLASSLNVTVEYLMETDETQAEKICIYHENVAGTKILNNDLDEAEENIRNSLYYAQKYKLEKRIAKDLYLKGLIHSKKEEYSEAQKDLLTANAIFIKNNLYEEIVNTFLLLGKITLKLKAYHSAYSYFQQSEKIYEDNKLGNEFLIGEIYYYIACTYFKLGVIDKSIEYCFKSDEKFGNMDNKKDYANKMLSMAKEYFQNNNINNAIKYSKVSLKVFKEMDNVYYLSKIENDLGKLFSEFDNVNKSFSHLYKARDIRERTKDNMIIETLCNICENYIKLKDDVKAKEVLVEILNHIENGEKKSLCDYYLLKYRVELLEGKIEEAEQTLVQTLNYVKKQNFNKLHAEIALMLGKFYIDNGRDEEAKKYLDDGVKVLTELKILDK